MISDIFLKIVRCPITKEPLQIADAALLAEVNLAISRGALANRGGETIDEPIEAGLAGQSGAYLYRVDDGIPNLIADDAIPLDVLTRRDAARREA